MSKTPPESTESRPRTEAIDVMTSIPFLGVHASLVLLWWTGVSPVAAAVGLVTLAIRMFGLTGGYHRYFCHRSYQTSRWFQFVLAWVGASAAQKGPLWWSAHHRHHHRHADTEEDVHPPGVKGLYWAHAGWIMARENSRTRLELIPDFAEFPELRWLDRYHFVAPATLIVGLYALGEWLALTNPGLATSGGQMVIVAFSLSTVVLYHVTFAVNSIGHTWGSRRYETGEDSRNSFLLALITGGEGWHNNHHRFPASERQGFYWWEIDPTHYVIVVLRALSIVWNVRGPSQQVLDSGRSG